MMGKPISVLVMATILLAMAALAIPSGILFLIDPSGSLLGGQFILPRLTAIVPLITNFVPVGLWLVTVFGVLPIVIASCLLLRRTWSWKAGAALGGVEVSWIAAEVALFLDFGFTPMYPLFGGIGILTIITSLNPSIRKYLTPTV